MDLLSKRYASPFLLLDEYIEAGCLAEFIDEFFDIVNQENEDQVMWDYYLHRVFDKSYEEFVNQCKKEPEKPVDFKAAINNSISILEGFVPE